MVDLSKCWSVGEGVQWLRRVALTGRKRREADGEWVTLAPLLISLIISKAKVMVIWELAKRHKHSSC